MPPHRGTRRNGGRAGGAVPARRAYGSARSAAARECACARWRRAPRRSIWAPEAALPRRRPPDAPRRRRPRAGVRPGRPHGYRYRDNRATGCWAGHRPARAAGPGRRASRRPGVPINRPRARRRRAPGDGDRFCSRG